MPLCFSKGSELKFQSRSWWIEMAPWKIGSLRWPLIRTLRTGGTIFNSYISSSEWPVNELISSRVAWTRPRTVTISCSLAYRSTLERIPKSSSTACRSLAGARLVILLLQFCILKVFTDVLLWDKWLQFLDFCVHWPNQLSQLLCLLTQRSLGGRCFDHKSPQIEFPHSGINLTTSLNLRLQKEQ